MPGKNVLRGLRHQTGWLLVQGASRHLAQASRDVSLLSRRPSCSVHPRMQISIARGAHHTSASRTSSLGTQEALVQWCGSWHSGDTSINNLKTVHFKVLFSLEFALSRGEVNSNNPFYLFPGEKRTWSCHLCLSPCHFSLTSVCHPSPTGGHRAPEHSAGEPCGHPGTGSAVVQCPPSKGRLSSSKAACHCPWQLDTVLGPGDQGLHLL